MAKVKRAVGYWRHGRLVHGRWTLGWSSSEHWLDGVRYVYRGSVATERDRVVDVFVAC